LSNYTQSTNFATKDALTSGDPLKIVKGTEINTEFVNISVAIATKADLASPTFTGTVVIPTATISGGTITGITDLAIADGGTGASTAANARTNLGLVIGTNVQAWDTDLDTWATKSAPTGTVVGTSDTQTLTNKTLTSPTLVTPNIDSAQFATVSGTAPLYAARAWVNFNGTGTVAIRASGNVSSITDNGTGNYTVNINTAMADANYAVSMSTGRDSTDTTSTLGIISASRSTTGFAIQVFNSSFLNVDCGSVNASIFR